MCASGGSKIAMGRRWLVDAHAMGAPPVAAPFVPWIELLSGAFLVAQWQRSVFALVVAGLLLVFTVLIVVNLARDHRPVCACFGVWSRRPIGWLHVWRNLALIAVAVIAVF